MMMRGLGCVPDATADVDEDLRDRHVGLLIGASTAGLPASVDYSALIDRIQDQGASQSCCGQAFATAVYLRAKIASHPIYRPSAKAIYDLARLAEGTGTLVDIGCRPRLAIEGMQESGLVADARWPLTDANVNELPPLDVFRAGLGALVSNHYRIGGGDIATLARVALSKGFVPFFAMPVDQAFMELNDAGPYDGLTGPVRGSHAMCLVAYDVGSFLVCNSWGLGWADRGFCRITDRAINAHAFDCLVVTTTPEKVS